ncbi:MAG: hypothetical protein HFE69_21425 [Enterobacter hormaechei subsp. steigerwaltii]|nr:hypothetical protein [Enterobacter hormaechei subsp. steigerwaltii]
MSDKKDFENDAEQVRNAVLSQLKQTLNRHRQLADGDIDPCGITKSSETESSDSPEPVPDVLKEPEPQYKVKSSQKKVRIVSGSKALSHVVENIRKRKAHVAGAQKTTPVLVSVPRGAAGYERPQLAIAASLKRRSDAVSVNGEKTSPIAAAIQVNSLDTERQRLNNRDYEEEIKLKKSYGKWFLIILACQLLVMNGVFILDGWKVLSFEDLTLQLYMGGTLTEVFGLVLVVTKYLFKRK